MKIFNIIPSYVIPALIITGILLLFMLTGQVHDDKYYFQLALSMALLILGIILWVKWIKLCEHDQ